MLLEIMLKLVQVHTSITGTQQVSTSGHFALDFASLEKLAINTSKRCPKSVTDYVVMHLLQHKKLASITCAELSMEDRMMRGMVYPLTEHELFRQYCRPGGHLSRQDGEIMKQYVSRRRRCWTLLVQVDPVTHVSDGHRSDMLLDLSGLTREERVMVQASISRERDFNNVAFQHPRIHLRESQRETEGKGKDRFNRGHNSNTPWQRKIWSKCLLRELHFR